MVTAQWTKVFEAEELRRSSQTLAVVDQHAYIYGGELRPRQPVDADVHVVALGPLATTSTGKVEGACRTITSSSGPTARVGAASTALHGKIYLFSGRGGVAMSPIEEQGCLWVFDLAEASWTVVKPGDSAAPYPPGRSYHAIANDGKENIFIHAGCPEKGRLGDLWSFNIRERTWKELALAPDPPRGGPSIAFHGGKLYRMNGFDGKTEQGGSIDVYEFKTNTWKSIQYPADGQVGPIARSVGCLLELEINGNPLLVTMFGESDPSNLGHQGAGKMLDDVWAWDIQKSFWTKLEIQGPLYPPPRGWFDADVLYDAASQSIIVQGGLAESNERLGDLWLLSFSK